MLTIFKISAALSGIRLWLSRLVIMQKKLSAGAILFRVKGQGSQEKIKLMRKLLMGYRDKLLNHCVIISKSKIRVIPLGDRK
jgi:hypothetical protein